MSLVQRSLSGGVLILFLTAVRALLLHRLPKRTFLCLWAVALCRLLLPFALPAPCSVYALLAARPAPVYADAAPDRWVTAAAPGAAAPAPQASAVGVSVWPVVWAAGFAVCALFFAISWGRSLRLLRESLPDENVWIEDWLRKNALRRTVTVRRSDRFSAPLTYGVLHPVILLPADFPREDPERLGYVLTHELVHIRRFDGLAKLALIAAACVHWFNPLVWLLFVLANRDLELSCDEAVVRAFGTGGARAAYAHTLLDFAGRRGVFAPLGSEFGKNAMEERICAIMKLKKTSAAALLAAVVLVLTTSLAFATSAPEQTQEQRDRALNDSVRGGTQEMLSYTDPTTGKTWYSADGGKTFETLTEEEYKEKYGISAVEWWTAEEYAAWLEEEKAALQSMLGETGRTGSEGEFVWTQARIDETVALYEEILREIQNGLLVSKTVDGSPDTMLTQGIEDRLANGGDPAGNKGPSIEEYEPFGLAMRDGALWYDGEKVRWFEDSAPIDGGRAVRCRYFLEEGTVGLRTVRQAAENEDGSTDPFGPLLRLERLSEEETEQCIREDHAAGEMAAFAEAESDLSDVGSRLDRYALFGLTYTIGQSAGEPSLRMVWNGRAVHSLADAETGEWFANSMRGLYLPDAVDVQAVYENGVLTGLREVPCTHRTQTAEALSGDDAVGEGTPLPDMFAKYEPFGVVYEETQAWDGTAERRLSYGGRHVNRLADIAPDGSVFTFASTRQDADGIDLYAVYEDGVLTGVTE